MISQITFAAYTDSGTVKAVQSILNAEGFDCGQVDGLFGKKTAESIRQYQEKNKLTVSGEIDADLLAAMQLEVGGDPCDPVKKQWKQLLMAPKYKPATASFVISDENTEEEIVKKINQWIRNLTQIDISDVYTVQAVCAAYDALSDESKDLITNAKILEDTEEALRSIYIREARHAADLFNTASAALKPKTINGVAGLRAMTEVELLLEELSAFGYAEDETADGIYSLKEMKTMLAEIKDVLLKQCYPNTGLVKLDIIADVDDHVGEGTSSGKGTASGEVKTEGAEVSEEIGTDEEEAQYCYSYKYDQGEGEAIAKAYSRYLKKYFTECTDIPANSGKEIGFYFQDDLGNRISVVCDPADSADTASTAGSAGTAGSTDIAGSAGTEGSVDTVVRQQQDTVRVMFDKAIVEQKLHEYHGVNRLAGKPLAYASEGDKVYFGSYEQDMIPENGSEPLLWTIIKMDDDCIQLACESMEVQIDEEFRKTAFTQKERDKIKSDPDQEKRSILTIKK